MITAFSMRANGWVNFNPPTIPTPRAIANGRAIWCKPMDVTDQPVPIPFAYATKEAAESFNIDQPAIPREWAKIIPMYPGQEE